MKRIAHFILLFALWGIVLLAPSCKSNDPEVPSNETAFDKAVGANPIALIIPCHRVIAAHGKLGGYEYGIEIKKRLLEREQL